MPPAEPSPPHPPLNSRQPAAPTLIELALAMMMAAIILVAAFTGIASLRKSDSASARSAAAMADQTRLLDHLTLDLRRAVAVPVMDTDDQGIKITVPDSCHFNASDPRHLSPIANDAVLGPAAAASVSRRPATPTVTTQTIAYRFLNGVITRTDPWQPLVKTGANYVGSGPVTIASNMTAFPTITADPADPADPADAALRYRVTFHAASPPLAPASATRTITVHNAPSVPGKNLAH